jgi:hypothetical protein
MSSWLQGKRSPISFTPQFSYSKHIYNDYKSREEVWVWLHGDAREFDSWMMDTAYPIRQFKESFMGGMHSLAPDGLLSENFFGANGNPAPADGNFVQANYWIGGLDLRCLGAAGNDWVAIHMGSNYPITLQRSPHLRAVVGYATVSSMFSLIGLVGFGNLERGNGNPWTVPDAGIWVEYDASVDSNCRFVTSKDGVQTVTSFEPPICPAEWYIQVNDESTSVKFFVDCVKLAEHTTNLPTFPAPERLKLLFMIGRHGAFASWKDCYLQEINLMFDR